MKEFGDMYADPDLVHIQLLGDYPEAHYWDGSAVAYNVEFEPEVVKEFKIYDYLTNEAKRYHRGGTYLPVDIDYKTGLKEKLHPRYTYIKGELQKTIYYGTYDESESLEADRFKDPTVRVDIVYERDAMGFARKRTTERYWYYKDGTYDVTLRKTTTKYYDNTMTIVEGKRRRGNIVTNMTMPIMGMMMGTELGKEGSPFSSQEDIIIEGRRWLASHKADFIDFVDDSNPTISASISTDVTAWLDNYIDGNGTTIRMYMLNELNIQDVL